MTSLPFQLLIKRKYPDKKTETVTCTNLLREIPCKRQVYEANWNNREVIVKLFFNKFGAKYNLQKEWRGLNSLRTRQLRCPEPFFYGQTKQGHWAMVEEKVISSSTVLELVNQTDNKTEKFDLFKLVCDELVKQHQKGVIQKDLHMGNFLITGEKIFALDAGQMRFFSRPIPKTKSISQLAMLVCWLPKKEEEHVKKIFKQYTSSRGWQLEKSHELLLKKEMAKHRKKGIRRGLKKFMRTNKRHLLIKQDGFLAVLDRNFYQNTKPTDFIKQVDSLMDKGQILKDGNTCYVSCVTWNGKDVVVKRYNHKGFIHSLRQTIKKSRALRSWLHGHRLTMLGLATPQPLAYIEKRKGPIVWNSYIVTEYIAGQKLYDFLQDKDVTEHNREEMLHAIEKLLENLHDNRISHGDLKQSNILIKDNKPCIIDLDAIRVHEWGWTHKIRQARKPPSFATK